MSILDTDAEILKQAGVQKMQRDISLVWIRRIIGSLLLLTFVSLALYCFYFCGGISDSHSRWSEFGDYIAGIAGILNVIAFTGLTIIINVIDKRNVEHSARLHNEREKQNTRLQAEKFVILKLRPFTQLIIKYHIAFQQKNSKAVIDKTFEYLQPLMTYLFYLKSIDFLPQKTKDQMASFHQYLFDASDILYSYVIDVETNKGHKPKERDISRVYREVIRRLEELDVLLTSDVAGLVVSDEDEQKMRYIPVKNREKL